MPGGVTCRCSPSGRGGRDFGRRARLLFAAADRARPDQPCPWAQTKLDREPPHSDAGDGGSRSRAAARYSSVASLMTHCTWKSNGYPAEALALTESTRPTQFPEESFGLVIGDLVIEQCGLEKWEDSFESLGRDEDQNQGKSQGSLGKIDCRRHPRSPWGVRP